MELVIIKKFNFLIFTIKKIENILIYSVYLKFDILIQ